MNNKLLWVVVIIVVVALGFTVVKGQKAQTQDTMMEDKKDAMMESTGASSADTMMKDEDVMMKSSGATGEDKMMKPTGEDKMMEDK